MDYHLNADRLTRFIDGQSWPNSANPLANVEAPKNDKYGTWCDCDPGFWSGHGSMYLKKNNTAYFNKQQVGQAGQAGSQAGS